MSDDIKKLKELFKRNLELNEKPPKPPRGLIVAALLLLALITSSNLFLAYVGPGEFGIKQVKLGVDRGIRSEVYDTGWVFVVPGVSVMHTFPRGLQVLDLTGHTEERAARSTPTDRAAHIQTSDGFYVDADVTILYRIVDPYKVFTTLGPGVAFITNGMMPRAEPALKQALGNLTTEEFYNTPLRTEKVKLAEQILQEQVQDKGLKVEQVLVRYFRYSPEIQKNIEEKKLKDQLVFKNQSEKRAATEEALLMKAVEEGKANIAVKLEEGKAYVTNTQAKRDLLKRKRQAEADLQVRLAEAYRTELKNKALEGSGSSRMVGLKMAEVLQGIKFLVLPSDGPNALNPFKMDQMLQLIEGKKSGDGQ